TVEVPLGGRLRPARSAAGPHHSRRVRLRAPRAGTEAPWPLRLPLTAPGPALPGAAIAFGDQAPVVRRQLSLQFGLPVALLLLRRGGVGLLRGQRTRDVLQRLPFGADTEDQLGEPAQQHGPAPDEEPEGDQVQPAAADELAEERRAGDSARRGADREEQGDGEGAGLHREDLADRQVGGAGPGRRDEEAQRDQDDERRRG